MWQKPNGFISGFMVVSQLPNGCKYGRSVIGTRLPCRANSTCMYHDHNTCMHVLWSWYMHVLWSHYLHVLWLWFMQTLWLEYMRACMQSIHSDFQSWPAKENEIATLNFDVSTLKPKHATCKSMYTVHRKLNRSIANVAFGINVPLAPHSPMLAQELFTFGSLLQHWMMGVGGRKQK